MVNGRRGRVSFLFQIKEHKIFFITEGERKGKRDRENIETLGQMKETKNQGKDT